MRLKSILFIVSLLISTSAFALPPECYTYFAEDYCYYGYNCDNGAGGYCEAPWWWVQSSGGCGQASPTVYSCQEW